MTNIQAIFEEGYVLTGSLELTYDLDVLRQHLKEFIAVCDRVGGKYYIQTDKFELTVNEIKKLEKLGLL